MSRLLLLSFDTPAPAPQPTSPFDTRLVKPLRTIVRNAVIAQLAPLLLPTGFVEAIIPIGFVLAGAHDDLGIDLLYEAMRGRGPAIAVACSDLRDQPAGAPGRSQGKLDVELYFLSTHLADMLEGRTETDAQAAATSTADQGMDAMLELAWQLLLNLDLGPKTSPLLRLGEAHVISDNRMTVWKQHWQTTLTLDANLNRGVTQKLVAARTTLQPTGDEPSLKHMVEDTTLG